MTATVSTDPNPPPVDPGEFTPEELAEAKAVWERARQRAIESGAIDPDEPVRAPSLSALWTDWDAVAERRQAEEKSHQASCVADYCDRCGRYACGRCHRVRVDEWNQRCWGCLVAEHLPTIGLPRRYADTGFARRALETLRSRVQSRDAIDLARKTISELVPMVFAGPAGAGKSSLAAACAGQYLATALSRPPPYPGVRWYSAIDLGLARSRHRLGSDEEPAAIQDAIDATLLVLDDLGAEGPRDHDAIAQVIHGRHDANRVTWVTTALTSTEIGTRYGGGLERRIVEGATVIRCGGAK